MTKPPSQFVVLKGKCLGPGVCPLTKVKPGAVVCIKRLITDAELTTRLRELGLGEEQKIRLLSCHANYICQVCNARLGLSPELAENILVEPLPFPPSEE